MKVSQFCGLDDREKIIKESCYGDVQRTCDMEAPWSQLGRWRTYYFWVSLIDEKGLYEQDLERQCKKTD